jgi:hypothetical protein
MFDVVGEDLIVLPPPSLFPAIPKVLVSKLPDTINRIDAQSACQGV